MELVWLRFELEDNNSEGNQEADDLGNRNKSIHFHLRLALVIVEKSKLGSISLYSAVTVPTVLELYLPCQGKHL
jgi:hypothetical protein